MHIGVITNLAGYPLPPPPGHYKPWEHKPDGPMPDGLKPESPELPDEDITVLMNPTLKV